MTATRSATCPSCGTLQPPGGAFCPGCGRAIAPAEDVSARKTVTLLFCDMTGSTALGERFDAEAVRQVMTRYFDVVDTAVARHGGTVEKYVGDAALAVFGVPAVREDDPLRAVRAAVDLAAGLAALDAELSSAGVRLGVRIGVNTGAVIVGGARAGGSFATGDAVNTAARLEQSAAPGEVLLGEATWRRVSNAVEAEPVPPLTVKGKSKPVSAYRLLRLLDDDQQRVRARPHRLIGRDRELQLLSDLFGAACGNRMQTLSVLGPAGIGKTTLIESFLAEVGGSARVLTGRCLSYGAGSAYQPIVQIVRQAVGLSPEASVDAATEALSAAVGGGPDTTLVVQCLLSVLGLSLRPCAPDEVSWGVRRLLDSLAGQSPLVISIDDLHWADRLLIDLLDAARQQLADRSILLVLQARPEPENASITHVGEATLLTLLPLDVYVDALLAEALGAAAPPELVQPMRAWTGGNPLFVHEMTAHLLEERIVLCRPDGCVVSRELSAVSVPPTVEAVLAARLDRLPAAERTLLCCAAVVGLEASAWELEAVIGPGDHGPLLDDLAGRDFIRRSAAERDGCVFRHLLIRDAAYAAMPKTARADAHERLADRLSTESPHAAAQTPALVAHHLEQALHLRRDLVTSAEKLATLTERTVVALVDSVHAAADVDDLDAAKALAWRAIRLLTPEDGRRRGLLFQIALFCMRAVDLGGAQQVLETLQSGPPREEGSELEGAEWAALDAWWQLLGSRSVGVQHAVAAGERLTALARESGDVVAFLIGVHLTLWTHTSLCVFGPAIALMDQVDAMGLAASRGVREFRTIAVVYGPVPTAEGAELVRQWLQEPSLKPHLQQTMRQCLLALLALAGRFDEAEAVLHEVEADLPTEDPVVAATSGLALRHYYVARGEIGKAAAAISRAVSWLDGVVGSEGFASTLLGLEALCRLELGQRAAAEAALAQAERWTAAEDIASVITNTVCRAELAAQDGRREDALRLSARAIEIMDRTDELFEIGEWRRALAAAHERLGDVDGAARRLREARGAFARKGVVPMVRRVDGELARLSRAAPDR